MAKVKEKESRTPWRENVELGAMALVLALLFKAFIFEISRIPSGSMQPTLMGSPETGVFDRLAVDKLSFRFRDPRRWEIVVFRHPLQQSMDMVKRLVGMPGEDFKIEHGDLWHRPEPTAGSSGEWSILRRPRAVQEETWKSLIAPDAKRTPWIPVEGRWSFSGRDLEVDGPGRVRFAREPVMDDYLDGYPASMRDPIRAVNPRARPGENPVGDLRVAGEVEPGAACSELVITLTEGKRVYRFRIPGPADASNEVPRIEVEGAPPIRPLDVSAASLPRLAAGRETSFAVQNLDDLLTLELNGETVVEHEIDPASDPTAGIVIEVFGGGARLEDVVVSRDIHYLAVGGPWKIPPEHYVMLGDNTQDSADSRDWRWVRFEWEGPDGFSEGVEGNFREGESPRYLPPTRENGQLVYFVDLYGERHFLERERVARAQPLPSPLVARHLIRGRGFAVFWPLRPWSGIWRLAWIH